MNIFRRLIGSKLGGFIALAFIGVIAISFIAGDINQQGGTGLFGPSSGEMARVGKTTLTVNDVQTRAQRIFEQIRGQRPDYTMEQFLAEGGLEQVTNSMISAHAIMAYGAQNGFRISKALIDAEIARIPAFADTSGKFNENQFRAMLAQQRIQEKDLREDIANQLMEQQLAGPVGIGAFVPATMVEPYARMLLERRTGEAIAVPSSRFVPTQPQSEAVLRAFYTQNATQFSVPEQRKLRYMLVDRSRFAAAATPTEAEIASAYKSRAAHYAARDSRSFTQLIAPSETTARDIAAKVAKGATLASAAGTSGLSAGTIKDVDKVALAGQSSDAVANAAFSAARGTLVGPIKAPLGWTLLHVDEVRSVPARTLADARAELVEEVGKVKVAQAFSDFLGKLDGQIGEGATFDEVAKANGLQILETPAITAQGVNLRDPAYKPDDTVAAILKAGFAMSTDDDPQIAQVKPEEVAALIAVADSIPAGPMPFDQARSAVQVAWALAQGATKAQSVADALAKAINAGQPVAKALADAKLTDLPTQALDALRGDLTQSGDRMPAPLAALFALNKSKGKILTLEQNRGFVVVRLDEIIPGNPAATAQVQAPTRTGLKDVFGSEYREELANAARRAVGVTRNESAIRAIAKALREANGSAQ